MNEKEEKDKNMYYQVKFIIVGDSNVGKTYICYNFLNGECSNNYEPTIGVDYQFQNVTINDLTFSIQLWDTAGSEKFRSITKGYYSNSTCCILVYDLTDENLLNQYKNGLKKCKIIQMIISFLF